MKLLPTQELSPRHRHRLPPLRELVPQIPPHTNRNNKLDIAVEAIRRVARHQRSEESVPFYSMREFRNVLGVALRTVAIAFERLEQEGLLVRLRGSHTRLTGRRARPMAPIRGVVGWLENMMMLRHYEWRRSFSRSIGDAIRRAHFVTDTILHWDDEELDVDFASRVTSRKPDIAVWFQPTRLHRQTFATLKDGGIRNLIICDEEMGALGGQIRINWRRAYDAVLEQWMNDRGIRRALLVEADGESLCRSLRFEEVARKWGVKVERVPFTPDLPRACAQELPPGYGIVLLDERSAIAFCEPEHFLANAQRHRVLFGRELPSIPFAQRHEYEADVLCYPMPELVDAIRELLLHWQAGEPYEMELHARLA